MSPTSAIPPFYWLIFGWYEPLLTVGGFLGAMLYPKETHDQQAPWPGGEPPLDPLPRATVVTIYQLAHVVGLMGLINFFVLGSARRYLFGQPAVQEKIVGALLTPLLFGDIFHMAVTLWALGETRWDVRNWSGMLWITMVTGITLLGSRVAWHLGIGRYVHKRDGTQVSKYH
ncbi:hypothetical protein C8Q75DRAFT_729587 [Abortiporus biennis]|nr:hypothetical protein C8Q75DRAFT_729587 [Abortiporus biennis]